MKTDHWRRHPVVLVNPDDDLTVVHQRIVAHVDESGRRRQSVVERGASILRPHQASALQRLKDDLEKQRAASPRKLPPSSTRASGAREVAEAEQNSQTAPPAEPSLPIGMEELTRMLEAQRDDIVVSLHETILESMLSLFGDELVSAQRKRSRADAAEIALADAQQRLEEIAVTPEAGTPCGLLRSSRSAAVGDRAPVVGLHPRV